MYSMEVEVFRLTTFEKDVNYAAALKTKTEGSYPNEKYYTTNELHFVGKHKYSRCDNSCRLETFDNNGKITEIVDYTGNICFVNVS